MKQINKHYGKNTALKNVNLSVANGSCYGLVGPNGAGKSTLLKILASVIEDYQGDIYFGHNTINKHYKKQIGYIPQEICLEQTLTALDNLYFFGRLYGLKGKQLTNRANEVLTEVGLIEKGKARVTTFSGGMKRRLNIGCAIMHHPNVIIMDEPTVGIDPQSRRYIFQLIEAFKDRGCTIIYASHYMEEVEQLCEDVAFIDRGNIVEDGHIESLLERYAEPSIFIKGEHGLPKNIKPFGSLTKKGSGYVLSTSNPLQEMEAVSRHCRINSVNIERLELMQPRLEDIFFSLTGSQLRD
ncbi:ABC transporter ATP-binding protein [Virgibacillus ainsalahensis]